MDPLELHSASAQLKNSPHSHSHAHAAVSRSSSDSHLNSVSLTVSFGSDLPEFKFSLPATAILQAALELASRHFRVRTEEHKLWTGDGKQLDHASSLRQLGLRPGGSRLLLKQFDSPVSDQVAVTVEAGSRSFYGSFTASSSLQSVLDYFSSSAPDFNFGSWTGIPAPLVLSSASASASPVELTIHIPGLNVPQLEFGGRKYRGSAEFARVSLISLGLQSSSRSPSKVKFRFSHHYQAPATTEAERAQVFTEFKRKMENANQIQTPENRKSHQSPSIPIEIPVIPADRDLDLFYSPSGIISPPADLPEEFFDITESDSIIYAASILKSKELIGAFKSNNESHQHQSNHQPPHRRFSLTRIRIRFPSHLYAEGTFGIHETVGDLRRFVSSLVADSVVDYSLFIAPPKEILGNEKELLAKFGLFPSAIVNFAENKSAEKQARNEPAMMENLLQQSLTVEEREESSLRPGVGLIQEKFLSKIRIIQTDNQKQQQKQQQKQTQPQTQHPSHSSIVRSPDGNSLLDQVWLALAGEMFDETRNSIQINCSSEGVVTIAGSVKLAQLSPLIQIVGKVDGIKQVKSNLSIQT